MGLQRLRIQRLRFSTRVNWELIPSMRHPIHFLEETFPKNRKTSSYASTMRGSPLQSHHSSSEAKLAQLFVFARFNPVIVERILSDVLVRQATFPLCGAQSRAKHRGEVLPVARRLLDLAVVNWSPTPHSIGA